jgi:hypothetical protein
MKLDEDESESDIYGKNIYRYTNDNKLNLD